MRVLIACEFSGIVRDAFIARGHDAISCDLLPSEQPGPHIIGDARDHLGGGWDVLIAHPPCRYLARAGARWWAGKEREQSEALALVAAFLTAPVARIAVENPIGRVATVFGPPTQRIQPWQFGHEETKTTCLWLKGLPLLEPTAVMNRRDRNLTASGQNRLSPGPNRWRDRSRTYAGIAAAMADQWGRLA